MMCEKMNIPKDVERFTLSECIEFQYGSLLQTETDHCKIQFLQGLGICGLLLRTLKAVELELQTIILKRSMKSRKSSIQL